MALGDGRSFNTDSFLWRLGLRRCRIFIIEGCITILVSIACWPIVPPFPEDCTFLSPNGKTLMLARVKADGGYVANDEISLTKALHYLKDWKIWTG